MSIQEDVFLNTSDRLSALIVAVLDDDEIAQPATPASVREAVLSDIKTPTIPLNRFSTEQSQELRDEIDALIDEYGGDALALRFMRTGVSEPLGRLIAAGLDEFGTPSLGRMLASAERGLLPRLIARSEIEWAERAALPSLITRRDLHGDLHCHTRASDGRATLQQMAEAASARGHDYLAITEHSQRLSAAHGLTPERLLKQIDAIDRVNDSLDGLTLLKGIEVDILEDGSLDLADEVLGRLDLVVGSVHSAFDLSRARQTLRLLKAMDHPYFTVLGHPTTREIGKRPPIQADWLRVIRHARHRGCFVELNSQPKRLDLTDTLCHTAKDEGVLVAIDSDAHSTQDLDNLEWGVGQARRGWLSADDVLNSRSLPQLRPLLRQTM